MVNMVEKYSDKRTIRVRFGDCCGNIMGYHMGYVNKGCGAPRR